MTPAYILHQRPYRESSLLLEVFSRDAGRLALVARGIKRGRQRKSGLMQSFTPLLLSWAGRGELFTLTDVEAAGAVLPLTGAVMLSGFYLNELLLRLLQQHDPHEELFHAYALAIQRLASKPASMAWTLRLFEKALLQELGYGLLLEQEACSDRAVQADLVYCYHLQQGPMMAEVAANNGPLLHGSTLLALANEQNADERVLLEAKTLMRAILAQYLGPRPLRSRELFRQLEAGKKSQANAAHEE
ncbi:MAG: DNA repair protein RecO [Thiohalomonadaceae bacterium]